MNRPNGEDDRNGNGARAVQWIGVILLWSMAIVLFFGFFPAFKIILLGLLATSAVASTLKPLVNRLPLRHGLAAVVVGLGFMVLVLGLLFLLSWLLVKPVQAQIARWPELKCSLDQLLTYWAQRLGVSHPVNVDTLSEQFFALVTGENVERAVARTRDVLAVVVMTGAFVFIGSIYILAEPPGRLIGPVLRMLPRRRVEPMRGVVADLELRLRWWFIGTAISMTSIGIASYVGYSIAGLQFALPLAIFAALAEAVPTIGPLVTLMLALLLAATQGTQQIIGVAIVYGVVQSLESYVLIPLVMRKTVQIPPIVTLFSIVLWGKIFGVAGLLLAIPIDLAIWSLLDRFLIRERKIAEPGS